jgi:hypothetical protein
MLEPAAQETLRLRLRREWIELRFLLFRLRFQLKQGLLVAMEARRWRRFTAPDDDFEEASAGRSCSLHPGIDCGARIMPRSRPRFKRFFRR